MLLYSWYLYIIHNFDYNIGFKWGGLQLVTACSLNSFKLFSKFTSRISPWLMLFEWYCDQYSYPVRDGWSTFRLKCGKQSPGWWVICHYPSLPTFLTWTISLAIYIYIMWQWNRVRFHRLIISGHKQSLGQWGARCGVRSLKCGTVSLTWKWLSALRLAHTTLIMHVIGIL